MASPLGLTDLSKVAYTTSQNNANVETSRDSNGNSTINNNSVSYGDQYNSIFNGSKFYYKPTASVDTVGLNTTQNNNGTTTNTNNVNVRSSKPHQPDNSTDDLYDISTNSIIQYTNDENLPALKLKPADFAYLRDFGVYPNNRLITCRRFPSPVENDLTAVNMSPISTIVSWIPDDAENFFSFQTSEKWDTHNTTEPLKELTDIFNSIFAKQSGIDVQSELKNTLGGASKLLPIGGVAESLETTVVNYLLGTENNPGTNFSYDNLAQGNPNFMGESAHRKMNSIQSSISIPVKVVYEMKYIKGVDPTIVFMDLVQNLLRFSSSQSVFYITQQGGKRINSFFNKFKNGDWIGALGIILDGILYAVEKLATDVIDLLKETGQAIKDGLVGAGKAVYKAVTGEGDSGEKEIQKASTRMRDTLNNAFTKLSNSALARYRIEFSKIIPAATGASSAPWHLMIGSPKNPFFSSGDMIVENGTVNFGNTLGFNDLPTRIEFSFTIKSARSLGIQEIFDKFNNGSGRQYQRNNIKFQTDFYQGSVKNTGGGTTNAVTGAQA
jgi:hypothetical protein